MFKYYITAYVEGHYVTEKVTKITVYAINAQEAEQKARSSLPENKRYSHDVWIVRIDKIEEALCIMGGVS